MSDVFDADTPDTDWEVTRERQLLAWASATHDQRLAWLEDAIRLAWSTGALPRPRPEYERWTREGATE